MDDHLTHSCFLWLFSSVGRIEFGLKEENSWFVVKRPGLFTSLLFLSFSLRSPSHPASHSIYFDCKSLAIMRCWIGSGSGVRPCFHFTSTLPLPFYLMAPSHVADTSPPQHILSSKVLWWPISRRASKHERGRKKKKKTARGQRVGFWNALIPRVHADVYFALL